jgi:hypothetical protein
VGFNLGCLEEAALLPAGDPAVLVEQPEGALARLVALAGQVLQGAATGGLLAAADDPAALVLHQVGLGEATGGVVGGAVVHLGLGADGNGVGHSILGAPKLTAGLCRGRDGNCGCSGCRGGTGITIQVQVQQAIFWL